MRISLQSDLDNYRFYQCYESWNNIKCERIYDLDYNMKKNSKLISIPKDVFHPISLEKIYIYLALMPNIDRIDIS